MADEYIVRIEDPIYIQAVSSVDPLLVYLRGYNAYEVAVQAGFEGTREEWLASLAEEATLICEGYRDEAQTARDELDPVLINIATLLAIGAKLTEIDTVSDNIDAILTVNADLILGLSSKIGIVAGSIANVNNVGASIANVNNVGESIANVNSVAEKLSEIDTVGASIANVNNVGESIANVNSVAEKLSEVETVAGDLTNIDTVAGEIDDVNTVATNIADVNLAADNIVAIQAAPTYAEEAEKWAENPEDSQVETGKYSALHHSAKASAAQTAAEAAQDKAEDWAEETEDVEVEFGKYSAKHWAAKAEDVVVEVADSTEKAGAASLAELNARLLALEKIVSTTITNKLEVTKEFNVWGKTNLILTGSGAATFAPDFIGQKYIDTAGGNVYVAVGTANAGNWRLV